MSVWLAFVTGLIFVAVGAVVWWSERTKNKALCIRGCKDDCDCWEDDK